MSATQIKTIKQAIIDDPVNKSFTKAGEQPVFTAHPKARLMIIGQAPGHKAQTSGIPWDDQSGEQLRRWLGMSDETFYDGTKIALMPMDFYFPGTGKTGDLPPRPGFAERWHPELLACLPNIALTILIGQYAQAYYLDNKPKTLTETAKNYKDYLPRQLPLPHPSPRNNIWKKKNPWFERDVVPALQYTVHSLLH